MNDIFYYNNRLLAFLLDARVRDSFAGVMRCERVWIINYAISLIIEN